MRGGRRAAPLLLLLACATCATGGGVDDAFSEELLLRPLRDGHVLAHFHFRAASRGSSPAAHARGFSRVIAQLLWASNASSFAVSLSRGAWDVDAWGAPPLAAPQGAALTARWLGADAEAGAEAGWRPLAHGLGGALCASLGALAEPSAGGAPGASLLRIGGGATRHASLGREPVCTENLTPWLKQLPCGDAAGLAALLTRRGAVAGARHVTLTVAARRVGASAAVATHTLTLVLRPDASRPHALAAALGGPLTGACTAAEGSWVHVALPAAAAAAEAPQPPGAVRREGAGGEAVWSYDLRALPEGQTLEPELNRDAGSSQSTAPLGVPRWAAPAGWRVAAHLTGRGDARGGLAIEAYRIGEEAASSNSCNGTLRLLQLLPPACRVWWHTLVVHIDGAPVPLAAALAARPTLVPHGGGARRQHTALLDVALALPPGARSARLAMRYSKAFLRLDELPPDAQRGVDLPSARLELATSAPALSPTQSPCDAQATPLLCDVLAATPADVADDASAAPGPSERRVFVGYTGGLLLTLPSPDASMPFNVICFVCTALALLHTGVLGAATRRAGFLERAAAADDVIAAAIKAAPPPKGLRARLRAKLLGPRAC